MKAPGRKIRYIVCFSLFVILLIVLFSITASVYERRQNKAFSQAFSKLFEEYGEKGILSLAGVPVENISYSGSDLFLDDRASWSLSDEERRNIEIYDKVAPSVVRIVTSSSLSSRSQASGVILSEDGIILTNFHVIDGFDDITIYFFDGSAEKAEVLGTDRLTDIALLKVERENLKPIDVSNRKAVTGQVVYTIGHPYSNEWSMSKGIVSGVDRTLYLENGVIADLIQTDSFVNPGNSGGPLLDSSGNMIALISSIYTTSGSSEGITFAFATTSLDKIVNRIIRDGYFERGMLEALTVELNDEIINYLDLPLDGGILISQTIPSGGADKAGIKGGSEKALYGESVIYLGGDIITEINGKKVRNYTDYFLALFDTSSTDTVSVRVYRNGTYINFRDVCLAEQNEENFKWVLR